MSKFVYPPDRPRALDPGSGSGVNTGFVMICFMVAETPDCGTSSGSVSAKNHRGRRVEVRFRTGSVRGGGATSSGNRLRHNTGLQQRQR